MLLPVRHMTPVDSPADESCIASVSQVMSCRLRMLSMRLQGLDTVQQVVLEVLYAQITEV